MGLWVDVIIATLIAVALVAMFLLLLNRSKNICVIIYGQHSPDWMAALAADAMVWKKIPAVKKVSIVAASANASVPGARRNRRQTVIIPLMEEHVASCPAGYPSLIPARLSMKLFSDKAEFAKYAAANGLAGFCPTSYANGAHAVFPCVLKRAELNGGQGVAIVESPDHLHSLLNDTMWRGKPFALQSLISGTTEYVTHCVCLNGRILWHCSFTFDLESPATVRGAAKPTTARLTATSAHCLRQIERFLAPCRYTGPCNVDYKQLENGEIAIFEINPRLGGSLMQPQYVELLRGALSCIIENALRSFALERPPV